MASKTLGIAKLARKGYEAAKTAAVSGTCRVKAAAKAFCRPAMLESMPDMRKKANIVLATDWGADGAETNVELEMGALASGLGLDASIRRVPGFQPLSDPLSCAVEFDRMLTTHKITSELLVRRLEKKGLSRDEIEKRLEPLVLVNVFDRRVGSERVAGIVTGKLLLDGGYSVPISLIGPLNNGIIRSLSGRLRDVECHELSNPEYFVDNLGCVTWDGRTKFGPAAVFAADGVPASEFGKALELESFPEINFRSFAEGAETDIPVVAVDEIGNVITGIDNGSLDNLAPSLELSGPAGSLLARKGDKFDDVQEGEAVFYKGSKGLVEVAVNMGNAAEGLGISGQEVELDGGNPLLSLRVSMRAGNASVRAA